MPGDAFEVSTGWLAFCDTTVPALRAEGWTALTDAGFADDGWMEEPIDGDVAGGDGAPHGLDTALEASAPEGTLYVPVGTNRFLPLAVERLRIGKTHLGDLAGLQAMLRPYQQAGLAWQQFLGRHGFGGLLADDMGLGKTVHALAHLLAERETGRLDRPSLLVAPTSVLGNWRAEAARFATGLQTLILHGPQRKAELSALDGYDLVVTSYALLPRDLDTLEAQPWYLVIFDEAQYLKNPASQAAKAARALEARQRLCLTGTPLENTLDELWSLVSLAVPPLLGDRTGFRRQFRTPIEKHGDAGRRRLLARRLRPFLLRRTKEEVAADLPAPHRAR